MLSVALNRRGLAAHLFLLEVFSIPTGGELERGGPRRGGLLSLNFNHFLKEALLGASIEIEKKEIFFPFFACSYIHKSFKKLIH